MTTVATIDGSGATPAGVIHARVRRWCVSLFPGALVPEALAAAVDDGDLADRRCMERLAAGDTQALRPIFDRWKLPLLSYFYRALGSRADAEDLALQVFERVYRAAPRFRVEARFSTWLFAIARGELLHELRRRRRKPLEPVAPDELAATGAATDHTAEMEEHLLVALQQLPERERSAVLLAATGDLDHAGIAAALGVSVNNLNVILHRARRTLRDLFQKVRP